MLIEHAPGISIEWDDRQATIILLKRVRNMARRELGVPTANKAAVQYERKHPEIKKQVDELAQEYLTLYSGQPVSGSEKNDPSSH